MLEHKLATTPEAMKQVFGSMPRCRMAMETGTHSPWVSRLLAELGHEVIVGHAQKVRLITKSRRKDDRLDARTLARLARIDPELLSPVKHRSAQAQLHLAEIRARAGLVSARTALVNAARGLVKSYGERLRKCDTQQVSREIDEWIEHRIARGLGAAAARGGIAKRTYPGIRSADRKNGQGEVSGSGVAQTGEGRGNTDRHDLCADDGGSATLPRRAGTSDVLLGYNQGEGTRARASRRCTSAKRGTSIYEHAGAGGALHFGTFGEDSDLRRWGLKLCGARRKKRQEASGRGGGTKVGGTAASVVGKWRGVRTAAQ